LSSPCYVMPHVFIILGKALGVFFDRHRWAMGKRKRNKGQKNMSM
jgi:hypothetical protein